MKILRSALFLIVAWIWTGSVLGMTVFIRGSVTDEQGLVPFPGHTIYIKTDFSSPFHYYRILTTDTDGFYADTILNVPSFPVSFQISTYDCENNLKVVTVISGNSPIIADFRICVPPVSGCKAAFSCDSISGLNYQFTDQSVPGDSLHSWNWNFGDPASGPANLSAIRNPEHLYTGPGIYNVKLRIQSGDGCKDSVVKTVFIHIPRDQVRISGHVFNDSTGEPISNHPVMINSTLMQYSDVLYSDSEGFYADTISSVPDGIPISVASYDCHNNLHSNTVFASSSPLQVDFHLCLNPQCVADFTALLDSNNHSENTFIFNDHSYGKPNRWLWSFGDGGASTDENPVHQYLSQGTFNVCLTITKEDSLGAWSCSDTLCQQVTTSKYHNLGGLLFAGSYPINNPLNTGDTGIAYLYRVNQQWTTPVDTARFTYLGYYSFLHILEGKYIVKAGLTGGSARYYGYLPAYSGNQLKWQTSAPFLLDRNLFENHISLIRTDDSLSGPGAIRGSVFHHGSGQKIGNAEVVLFNDNLVPVKFTYSDADGNYEFPLLPEGTYSLYPEITGKYAQALQVSVDSAHLITEGIGLEVFDFDLNGISPAGFENTVRVGKVFPNPSEESARVVIYSPKKLAIEAVIMTLTGVPVLRKSFVSYEPISIVSFQLQHLHAGVYFLMLKTTDGNLLDTQKIIRK